ncbi:MAG: pentapeptide repeat-containing protein [Nitrospinota bacterium]|nr:pentapeptide repeat-containing protein [Nitrospinota bacterium]
MRYGILGTALGLFIAFSGVASAEEGSGPLDEAGCAKWRGAKTVAIDEKYVAKLEAKAEKPVEGVEYSSDKLALLMYKDPETAKSILEGDRNNVQKTKAGLVDLSGYTFNGANLSGFNLDRVDLNGAEFEGANLSGATLRGADLSKASMESVNLQGADLTDASAYKAELMGANLSYANMSFANLEKTNLESADLCMATLASANLTSVELNNAYIKKANFDKAKEIPKKIHTHADHLFVFGLPVPSWDK